MTCYILKENEERGVYIAFKYTINILKRLKWSYFDTYVGEHDEYNPRYVYNTNYVPEISYLIATNDPFSLSSTDIKYKLGLSIEECELALSRMIKINAITKSNNKYKINFPVFLEKDLLKLENFCADIGKVLGEKIISLSQIIDTHLSKLGIYNKWSVERLRYHSIACDTLDGVALDYFSNDLITISKKQPDDRDYLIISHEDNDKSSDFSEKLLCSCNSYFVDEYRFMSFGDANGFRNDFMRFFRRLENSIESTTLDKNLNISYLKVIDNYNKELALHSARIMEKVTSSELLYSTFTTLEQKNIDFLCNLGYLKLENNYVVVNVPVFNSNDIKIIKELGLIIVKELYETVKTAIDNLDKSLPELTSIKHGVDFKDISNELWHLIFGPVNEYMVLKGFIENPPYKENEGRYLQAFYISNNKG